MEIVASRQPNLNADSSCQFCACLIFKTKVFFYHFDHLLFNVFPWHGISLLSTPYPTSDIQLVESGLPSLSSRKTAPDCLRLEGCIPYHSVWDAPKFPCLGCKMLMSKMHHSKQNTLCRMHQTPLCLECITHLSI